MSTVDTQPGAPITSNTLADAAADFLRGQIMTGSISAGTPVSVGDIATLLGVSQTPVREAMRSLSGEGLLVATPQRGFRVAELSMKDARDTYMLRRIVDPLAMRLSAPKLTEQDVDDIEESFTSLVRAYKTGDWERISKRHEAFHFGFYKRADSEWLLRVQKMLWHNAERYQRLSAPRRGTIEQRAETHWQLVVAVKEQDFELATELLEEHLARTIEIVTGLLTEDRK